MHSGIGRAVADGIGNRALVDANEAADIRSGINPRDGTDDDPPDGSRT